MGPDNLAIVFAPYVHNPFLIFQSYWKEIEEHDGPWQSSYSICTDIDEKSWTRSFRKSTVGGPWTTIYWSYDIML